ncbi:DUF4262 domain-containing protein [Dinghuibacter silviterrae]|uniref:DUF4262 domain-containing protein n=1 Tax=Dinghuibacter silviterrae TaxID=1539049 RepID=UPI0013C3640E|nr:DUF4262 domain-containing protein [Dinghuibacter silviterrae]
MQKYIMDHNERPLFKKLIQSNIERYGFHITIVGSGIQPRFAYTIGLTELLGFELVFAGGVIYLKDELIVIFNEIVKELNERKDLDLDEIKVKELGAFSLSTVDPSWSKLML